MSKINDDATTEKSLAESGSEQEKVFIPRHVPKFRDFKQELETFLADAKLRNVDYAVLLGAAKQIAFESSQEQFIGEVIHLFRLEDRHGLHGLRKHLRR